MTARASEKTAAFAARHGIERVVDSLEALVAHPTVDVVHIATPHPLHHDLALSAIGAGKHVLNEKSIAMNAAEAREITAAGRVAGVVVMEAMWTRHLPQTDMMHRVIADGVIGEVRLVTADFGFPMPYLPEHRLWKPALGGGALLDAGVYPIAFASSLLGAPVRVLVEGETGPGGVDARADLLLTYDGGARSLLSTSLQAALPARASVAGTAGRIDIGSPFFGPSSTTLSVGVFEPSETITWSDKRFAVVHDGLSYQATALASYVAEGRTESPLHPHAEVIGVIDVIDAARRTISGSA